MSDNESTPDTSTPRENPLRKVATGATLVGVLLVGGAAGATFFGPLTANAASPTAQPSTATASAQPSTGTGAGATATSTDQVNGTMASGPGGNGY